MPPSTSNWNAVNFKNTDVEKGMLVFDVDFGILWYYGDRKIFYRLCFSCNA